MVSPRRRRRMRWWGALVVSRSARLNRHPERHPSWDGRWRRRKYPREGG